MPADTEMDMLPSKSRRRGRKTLKEKSREVVKVLLWIFILLVITWVLWKPVLWVIKMMNETSQSDVDKELATTSPATVAPIDPQLSVTANVVPVSSSEPATTPPTSPVVVLSNSPITTEFIPPVSSTAPTTTTPTTPVVTLTIPPITTKFIPPVPVTTTPQPITITTKRKNQKNKVF
ncbi:hypothetical protein L3Y34_009318 [Caenorhabditis briggsae]|uniref:Uncharacterized protein n=1 Tax=Caenorhabditis briggsae TaxID=6238 RepID=A0AAE9D2W7_CAEBR|nr:hypothetical protein L3Y34_009317 [Caenorhabditis briggsae]ULT91612.1 hypothetical protein L3Y34_009318 [Caenorhabditis briggsae]